MTLNFDESPWQEVFEEIRGMKQGLQIYVSPSAVDTGLDNDELVTMNFTRVRLRTVLTTMLKQYDCTFVVQDGMLVIAEYTDCPLAVRTFNCAGILQMLDSHASSPKRRMPSAGGAGMGGPSAGGGAGAAMGGVIGFGEGGGNTRGGGQPMRRRYSQAGQAEIIELLTQMVSPDKWEADGATLRFVGAVLIVRQHEPQLNQIGQILDDLRSQLEVKDSEAK